MKIKNFDISKFNIIEDNENYYIFRNLNENEEKEIKDIDDDGIIRLVTDRNAYRDNLQCEVNEEDIDNLSEIWNYIKLRYSENTAENKLCIDYGPGYYHEENQKYILVRVPKNMKITQRVIMEHTIVEVDEILQESTEIIEEEVNIKEEPKEISIYDEMDFKEIDKVETIDKYDANGFDKDGYDKDGFDASGYNKDGYDRENFDRLGYNKEGYNKEGFDKLGYNKDGYDRNNFDRLGYNKEGYNKAGFDKTGYNKDGYDKDGFDKTGYNQEGFDRIGYDKSGYNANGFDKAGINKEGYNKEGYDSAGYDKNGYNKDGYNKNGIDKRGFDHNGYFYQKLENGTYANTKLKYNKYGFRADGTHSVTRTEVDLRNFDIDGKCKTNHDSNYDENGFKQDGTYKETGEKYHEGYNAFGVDQEGKTKTGEIHTDIAFAQEYIKSVMQGRTNEFISNHFDMTTITMEQITKEIDLKIYRASEMYPLLRNKIAINMMSVKRAITQKAKEKEKLNNENTTNKAELEKLQGEVDNLNKTTSEFESSTSEVENDKIKTII